jgi:hypothetical protein
LTTIPPLSIDRAVPICRAAFGRLERRASKQQFRAMTDRSSRHRPHVLRRLRANSREVALAVLLTFAALAALGVNNKREADKRARAPIASAGETAGQEK